MSYLKEKYLCIAFITRLSNFWSLSCYDSLLSLQNLEHIDKYPKMKLPIICFHFGGPPLPDVSNTAIEDLGKKKKIISWYVNLISILILSISRYYCIKKSKWFGDKQKASKLKAADKSIVIIIKILVHFSYFKYVNNCS